MKLALGAATLLGLYGLYRLYDWWMDRTAKRMVEEYMAAFPGRCMICSYHRFGLQEGLTQAPEPPPHDCIER